MIGKRFCVKGLVNRISGGNIFERFAESIPAARRCFSGRFAGVPCPLNQTLIPSTQLDQMVSLDVIATKKYHYALQALPLCTLDANSTAVTRTGGIPLGVHSSV